MANPAANVISGEYTATWNALTVGLTEDGYSIIHNFNKEEVAGDSYGDSVLDGVYRGGQCFVEFVMKEYVAATIVPIIWPYANSDYGAVGAAGRMDVNSSLALPLILTDVTGLPSETKPASITFHSTIIDNAHEVVQNYNNRHRVIPIRLRCYPTEQTSVVRWFTAT